MSTADNQIMSGTWNEDTTPIAITDDAQLALVEYSERIIQPLVVEGYFTNCTSKKIKIYSESKLNGDDDSEMVNNRVVDFIYEEEGRYGRISFWVKQIPGDLPHHCGLLLDNNGTFTSIFFGSKQRFIDFIIMCDLALLQGDKNNGQIELSIQETVFSDIKAILGFSIQEKVDLIEVSTGKDKKMFVTWSVSNENAIVKGKQILHISLSETFEFLTEMNNILNETLATYGG